MNQGKPDSICPVQLPLQQLLHQGNPLIDAAIREDTVDGTPASDALFDRIAPVHASITAKQPGVIAGLPVASEVFRRIDESIEVELCVEDGAYVFPGTDVARVHGPARGILVGERTALNFLQRMSGIATQTARIVEAVATTDVRIRDTRKTAPGARALDKYAVRIGGGLNHRTTLGELGMIKDTHIAAAGGIAQAVSRFTELHPGVPLEVEIRSLDELDELLANPQLPERILLDNMEPEALRRAVQRVAGRAITEASGGITMETVRAIATAGVDEISIGALTHSVQALDLSMAIHLQAEPKALSAEESHAHREIHSRTDSLVVLAHHYMPDDVVALADVVGDSLALARAARTQEAQTIVFSGVRFMGETAAALCRPEQRVLMPVPGAGCFLADCADIDQIEAAWAALGEIVDVARVMPVTYVNSSIALKAFCGKRNGLVCTSANAVQALAWTLERGERAFFFPDRHLATNAALSLGIDKEAIHTWIPDGYNDQAATAQVVVWPGACNVHQRFRPDHVEAIRHVYPGASVIVHPECPTSVVSLADEHGSTSRIVQFIQDLPSGATVAVGTEASLVQRLQRKHPDKRVLCLADVPPYCRSMQQTTRESVLDTLEAVEAGNARHHEIEVPDADATWARVALERMLELA